MTQLVYATQNIGLHDSSGILRRVRRNEPWAADDPLVKANPSFFQDEPVQVMRSEHPVEAATREPGEKRGPGRPRKDR